MSEQTKRFEFHGLQDQELVRQFGYIGGNWTAAQNGATFNVTNPADGTLLGHVASMTASDARSAIASASQAFGAWSQLLPQHRSAILRRWYELITANAYDLARIMTFEQGKPISEAIGEIEYAASFVEFYSEETKRPNIEGVTSHLPNAEVEVWRQPVGVAALITPWNFPSAMLTRKAAAALAKQEEQVADAVAKGARILTAEGVTRRGRYFMSQQYSQTCLLTLLLCMKKRSGPSPHWPRSTMKTRWWGALTRPYMDW